VNAGGTFAPGNPLGTLGISNSLTLAAGSVTFIPVQPATMTNGAAAILDTLTEGGTLVVTNLGGVLADGSRFKLFNASHFLGTFDSFDLPPLPAGGIWSTARLNVDGSLGVISTNLPAIHGFTASKNQLHLSGAGGTPNGYYSVLASTNLLLPIAGWVSLLTNQFDAAGDFSCTNIPAAVGSQTFYRLQVQ
jgi:hypothetical protein